MDKKVFIIGAGGHAKVLIDTLQCSGIKIAGILELDPHFFGKKILGIEVFSEQELLQQYTSDQILLINGVGSINLPNQRSVIFTKFKKLGYQFLNVIHPNTYLSKTTECAEGVQIMAGVIVQPNVSIGDNVIVNTKVSIDHDCKIANHVHLAPGVTLSGSVVIEDSCHLGTGAVVIHGITIGARSLIGAGSVIIHNIPEGSKVIGVPGRIVS